MAVAALVMAEGAPAAAVAPFGPFFAPTTVWSVWKLDRELALTEKSFPLDVAGALGAAVMAAFVVVIGISSTCVFFQLINIESGQSQLSLETMMAEDP